MIEALTGKSLIDLAIQSHPHAFYGLVRDNDPVHFDEQLGMYLVSRYEDLQVVLRDAITFSQERGWNKQFAHGFFDEFKAILERDGGGYFPDVILQDPPKHTRIRKLLEKAFTAHRMKTLEPNVGKIVANLLDALAGRDQIDGISDIATPMTIGFMCEQLGFEHADAGKIKQWSDAYVAQVGRMQDREQMLENAELICELQNYVIDRVRERQAQPREDMVSDLVTARLDDDDQPALTFAEIVALTRALLVGGNDTTSTGLSNLLYTIATRPDLADELYENIDNDRFVTRFVEESLRIEPPVRGLSRVTTKEVELGGKIIPEDSHLLILFASGNDDSAVFDNPRDFDPSRKNLARHLSFGAGTHLCVAMALARMEAKIAIREIVKRFKNIELAVPAEELLFVPTIANFSRINLPLKVVQR
ncbi:cytochrome P450 [Novosphingobium sp. G106]|uniref:cytochrome P450 n=1 Tax=Novosphingobium sp. G106 TaxID=2849500 RepID=UPI001C2D274B|nr:cytochrome P450 [Novosphingobium sp. G106]MBV1687190.1 cytochrome P450 [Novosphingobium sp. G106]